jgi:DNA invertase Pin-like site-specific DNA recombinase
MSFLPPPGSRVVIYARYSTNMQTFKSIEDQVAICRKYAERHEWEVVAVYHDAERSGTTLVGRDGFFEMMAAAERGEFTVVVVEDVDRLSRNAADTHSLFQELNDLDITVFTVSSGPVSDTDIAFKAVQNSQYVKQLAQKTRRGQEGTVRSGRISGSVAYGYKKAFLPDGKNGHRVIDEVQAPTCQTARR